MCSVNIYHKITHTQTKYTLINLIKGNVQTSTNYCNLYEHVEVLTSIHVINYNFT